MIHIKRRADEFQAYLEDTSHVQYGPAEAVVFPETTQDVARFFQDKVQLGLSPQTPVTISGAGTGTVGGRLPHQQGVILATDALNRSLPKTLGFDPELQRPFIRLGPGIRLAELYDFLKPLGLVYPVNPTEKNAFLGGNVSTNATGPRSFTYGPTRNWVRSLTIVLSTGNVLHLRRGQIQCQGDVFHLSSPRPPTANLSTPRLPDSPTPRRPTADGQPLDCSTSQLPTDDCRLMTADCPRPAYNTPAIKCASGYFSRPSMDLVDLFIGSEGTLGVIAEMELYLLKKSNAVAGCLAFFPSEESTWDFVLDVRRQMHNKVNPYECPFPISPVFSGPLAPLALEYFDAASLDLLRPTYPSIPVGARAALLVEQECPSSHSPLVEGCLRQQTGCIPSSTFWDAWVPLLERHKVFLEQCWMSVRDYYEENFRDLRHQVPVLANERFRRNQTQKFSTDIAVPDDALVPMMRFYRKTLEPLHVPSIVFGHIGDNHVHVNLFPQGDAEVEATHHALQAIYHEALSRGGVVSAEHGIGKLKQPYLKWMYGEKEGVYSKEGLRDMARIKKFFDPSLTLNRGNLIPASYLDRD